MATVELTTEQVIELIRRLPPERKREILIELARDPTSRRNDRMRLAEQELRRIAQVRGLNWNAMSEEQREALADELVHEDRMCAK